MSTTSRAAIYAISPTSSLEDQERRVVLAASAIAKSPSDRGHERPRRSRSGNSLIQKLAPIVGGKGGGKADLAQAGGKDPDKLDEASAGFGALHESSAHETKRRGVPRAFYLRCCEDYCRVIVPARYRPIRSVADATQYILRRSSSTPPVAPLTGKFVEPRGPVNH